jgi:TrmH family RNA methyltransferase
VPITTLVLAAGRLGDRTAEVRQILDVTRRQGTAVYEATAAVLEAASPVRTSSGIVAIAEWTPALPPRTLEPAPGLAVGIVDVQDPGNVGAIIRSADALGATGVIAVDHAASPSNWKALRGAMGSTFRIPVAQGSLGATLMAARKAGARVVAAVARDAKPATEIDFGQPTLLLLGSEGAGLSEAALNAATDRVTIPMRAGVESLNVAVTAALILYEARRQRHL